MNSNNLEKSSLGQCVTYQSTYDPTLLFPIPRIGKRDEIGVPKKLPFHGIDIWNAYELSWLNTKGKPQVAIAELSIPCTSPNIIESKSLKLYFNSFNQTQFESSKEVEHSLYKDLRKAIGCNPHIRIITPDLFHQIKIEEFDSKCIDNLDIEMDHFSLNPNALTTTPTITQETLHSHLLKSNCLVTGQPDWASIQISYKGPRIDHESLLKYIISFRQHNEFHEQCIERIFMDITNKCKPDQLTVYGRYTRRGGIDINPFRSNFEEEPNNLRLCRQ